MKKGFTLLELIVVVIILGILATVGLGQYMRMVEKSRGAEARSVMGAIRTEAQAIYMQNNNSCTAAAQPCSNANLGVVAAPTVGQYPGLAAANCSPGYYFWYNVANNADGIIVTATRCIGALGKQPGVVAPAGTIVMQTNFTTGVDTWVNSPQY